MEFTLKIKLGNDAIQTAGDLSFLVSRAAESIATYYEGETEGLQHSYHPQPIRDINGNFVGNWEVK